MTDGIGARTRLFNGGGVGDRTRDDGRFSSYLRNPRSTSGEEHTLVARGNESATEMGADKAGAARNHDSHGCTLQQATIDDQPFDDRSDKPIDQEGVLLAMPATEMPPIGLGTFSSSNRHEWTERVETALEVGYRHIDTAQVYGNEEYVGEGLRNAAVDREDVFLATKTVHVDVPPTAEAVPAAIDGCLDRLGVDYVDLLYVHWPAGIYEHEPILSAYNEAYDAGKTRYVGLSNFNVELLEEAREHLDAPLLAHQVEMHPLLPQEELYAYAVEQDIYQVAYSPLAKGEIVNEPTVQDVADKHDATPHQISLAWLADHDQVVPIPKASSRAHMEENLAALEIELDDEDRDRIAAIDREYRVIDPDHGPWNW